MVPILPDPHSQIQAISRALQASPVELAVATNEEKPMLRQRRSNRISLQRLCILDHTASIGSADFSISIDKQSRIELAVSTSLARLRSSQEAVLEGYQGRREHFLAAVERGDAAGT